MPGRTGVQQSSKVAETVGDILLQHNIEVIEYWTSIGRCSYGEHDDVFFLLLLSVNMLDVDIIDEVKEGLIGKGARLAYITLQEKGKEIFVQLVIELSHGPKNQ